MRILVLGSGAGGGFPQWNCGCANCRRAWRGDPAAKWRSQASLAVSADGRRWVLLNASPDLRQQIGANPVLHPRADGRDSPIVGVVLTSGDIDNVAGLLTLRERQPLAVYASSRIHALLEANSVFNVLDDSVVARRTVPLDRPVALAGADGMPTGLSVECFAVPGKVALYAENPEAGPDFGTRLGDSIGLTIAGPDGRRFHYLPGCAGMPEGLAARLRGASLVFFDGTLWRDDEMIATGLGNKTGRRMGHMSVSGAEGTMAAFAGLGIARKVFIHINNSNPIILDDTPERAAVEAAGWQVGHDGMELEL